MSLDEVVNLCRGVSLHQLRFELEKIEAKDPALFEKLSKFFQRAQRVECPHSWETLGDPPTHQRCKKCGKTLLIPET